MSEYRTITLIKRENVNCSSITEDEFVRMMFSDMLEAEEKYNDLYIPEWEAAKVKSFFQNLTWAHKRATNFAEKKWKTEKKRTAYIESEVAKARKEYKMSDFYYNLSFFDFDVNPGKMGISGNCCISYKELTPAKLSRCFEAVKDNKYFKKASGWKLTYEADNNSYRTCFRPHIKLIVDAETEAQMKKDAEDLTESVRNFYKGCTYWGD
jgi:hypothetical protein